MSPAGSRRCQSRSATPSIPSRSSTSMAPTRCAGSCSPIRRPSGIWNGARRGSKAPGGSCNGCGGWRRTQATGDGEDKALDRKLHQTIAAVGANIEALAFNKAVANIYELANAIEKAPPSASRTAAVETLPRLVAPMVPHVAEEAWAAAGREGLIADAAWPEADPALLVEDEVTIAVQVNGKLRDTRPRQGASREGSRPSRSRTQGPGLARWRRRRSHRRSRPVGEYRRMKRLALLAAALLLSSGCALRPMYAGGSTGAVATTLESVQVAPIPGRAGWLVRTASRSGWGGARATVRATGSRSSWTTRSPALASVPTMR